MFVAVVAFAALYIFPVCLSVSPSRLHIGVLGATEVGNRRRAAHNHAHRNIKSQFAPLSSLQRCDGATVTGVRDHCAFLANSGAFCGKTIIRRAIDAYGDEGCLVEDPRDVGVDAPSTESIASTRERIKSLSEQLTGASDHRERVQILATHGASLFKGAPEPSVLREPPLSLSESKRFRMPDSGQVSSTSRNYILFPPPCEVDYNLVPGCVSSIYVAVYVDNHGVVHVDGTSDSLITKATLALILDSVELRHSTEVLGMQARDVGHESTLAGLGFMKRDGVGTILNHIKSEVRSQSDRLKIVNKPQRRISKRSAKRVAALLSGGVDSSVALWLLKSRGYDVEAFYLKVWGVEKAEDTGNCEWATDVDHAMNVCSTLDVPLHILPFQDLYHEQVLRPYVEGTRLGETPNPDICCNEFIKFGAFADYATRWGFSHVASGHYASVVEDVSKIDHPSCGPDATPKSCGERITRLQLCKDLKKDQTYFLSRLTQRQLQQVIFPLCRLLKVEVRAIARTLGFTNHARKDSVGLCFLGKVDVHSFLAERLGQMPGPIVDCDSGECIGEHPGLYHFTVGQREGIAEYLSSVRETHRARYVVRKDVATNTLYVTSSYHCGRYVTEGGVRRRFEISDLTWTVPDYSRHITCEGVGAPILALKLRHSPSFSRGVIEFDDPKNPTRASVNLYRADVGVASGQYAAFYAGDECIGAGKMVASVI
ncbi:tRNA methyl transferase family protein, putative [Babesia bigemina]|uniref:tRNA-5-taurinomethyluridine 2-sulfurtransferase n=1 Tax=Babesia bigemina TaxID=5866 RepID=A0A061D8N9_BABBI|nr:tRNA methyl transferase family protein, putative [Babesia bigemina]CDR96898.1 tRNA methyl transferase family protein, putative [Babesia bigemina]|eukprot:XP_012769084.1 tRNA methyl transferase family protein, putative [Babesia bigemina]